jgi:hypothetical protein
MALVIITLCRLVEHCFEEWNYAECRILIIIMLNVVMLSAVMLNVIMLKSETKSAFNWKF